ncbi:serine hydrolase [Isoptericola halotolerans]|uniref:CubicO group peptidase (Beta-lactamase class C family) n=1 Tax=Isoptericola halotolerans TaxID=300560 RepID=A0ABX2A1M5_9MICO|nr:serine hydrolase [Isoptericola halotolerans]NOV95838.1 CubicO group peptidase (beta-lactamase class C family) [Isoptericola halotolerans]
MHLFASHPVKTLREFVLNPTLRIGDGEPGAPWSAPSGAPLPDGGASAELRAAVGQVADQVPGLHGVVVVHRGELVAEWYGRGKDFRQGRPLGTVTFGPRTLHDVRSVSKSVVALLYGIALADGSVPDPEAPLLEQFPEHADLATDPQRARITVGHALTMTTGLEWWERPPYTDPRNGEIAMRLAADPYRYVLGRPVVSPPGERWNYSGGTTEVLGRLISRGTGLPLAEFARRRLFAPLGLGRVEWTATTDRTPIACSGLRFAPRDLARIGQTVLDGGTWDGQQVVPADWIATMLTRHTSTGWGGYGYQWYLQGEGRDRWVGGIGNGDQRLHLLPEHDLVVVQTTGRYDGGLDTGPLPRLLAPVLDHVTSA